MPADNQQQDNIAAAITEVSDSLTRLVHDEIELAKAEMAQKAVSLMRGAVAVAAGAVFGIFAVVIALITVSWALDSVLVSGVGALWLGFLIVTAVLLLLALATFLFAWRKFKVGVPTPVMAIDEAKKIRDTVANSAGRTN
ncbi:MAG: phage holin family protein [Solirubrobacteraceae bacterium]